MARNRSEIDVNAPIHWVTRDENPAFYDLLPADERWTNSQYPHQPMLWHWEERRWWAYKEAS